jgi:hypothetical protein
MAIEQLLTEAIVRIIGGGSSRGMVGGGSTPMGIPGMGPGMSFLMVMLVVLIVLLLKALIVYLAFNHVVPSLIYSLDVKQENKSLEEIKSKFRRITFVEALLLVILMNTLFR